MRRLKQGLAVLGMILLFTACGGDPEPQATTQTAIPATQQTEKTTVSETEATAAETEQVTEADTEETTTDPYVLKELEGISFHLVDEYHGTKEDAGWETNQLISNTQAYLSENYSECTILTIAVSYTDRFTTNHITMEFEDTTGKPLDYTTALYEISDGQERYDDSGSWAAEREDGTMVQLFRLRIGGNVSANDLVAHIVYDDEAGSSVDKTLEKEMTFEELQSIFRRELDPWEDEVHYADMINKIKGRYYMVFPTRWGESTSTTGITIDGTYKHYSTEGYYFMFIPLQGAAYPMDIKEEDVELEAEPDEKYGIGVSDNWPNGKAVIQDRGTMFSIQLTYLADQDADWFVNWDNLSEEEKNGCSDVWNFANEKRYEKSLNTVLLFPDGDGGKTKISGTIPRSFNTVN